MYNLIWGLALVFFFLGFLFFLLRQRQGYFEYYPQSWRMVVLGVILLVGASGANAAFLLHPARFTFTTTGQKAVQAIEIFGYVTGGGLILAGFLKWCGSLVEVKKNATRRLRQLACLNSILSAINRDQQIDEILKESLSHLLHIMGYKMGVIFKPTFNSSEMEVVAHGGVPVGKLFTLYDLYSKNTWFKESSKSKEVTTTTDMKSLPEYGTLFGEQDPICSFACIPIKFCGKELGFMGLYDSKPDRFSYQEIQFLTSVGETLGLSAKQALTSIRNKKRRNYISALENMLKISQEATIWEEAFPRISSELKKVIDFDHVSLTLATEPGKNMMRISLGCSGGVLMERRVGLFPEGGIVGKVMSAKEVWLDRHLDLGENSPEDSLSKACGIKSRIILPLGWGESVYGILSLGHQEPNFYSASDVKWLRAFTLGFSHLVLEQALKEKLSRNEFLSRSLYESEKDLIGEEDLTSWLGDLAASLTLDLPKSFARVSLLSPEKDQLISCATHQIRAEGIDLKKEERFSLDNLPWHRLTLEARRPMLINQDDPESLMSRREAGLILDEKVNSAVLMPLILHDKAVGIISVGEMRNWDRQPLKVEEIDFIKYKANQICVGLEKGLLLRSNRLLRERLKSLETPEDLAPHQTQPVFLFSDLSYRINNSLASIRGSAELLRSSEKNLSANSLKYVKNIESGVDRIHQSLEEFSISTKSRRNSQLNRVREEAIPA